MAKTNINPELIDRLKEVGAPPRQLSLIYDLLSSGQNQHAKVRSVLEQWRDSDSNIFLSGPPLTQKTTAVTCMMWEVLTGRGRAMRTTLDDLVATLTDSWSSRKSYLEFISILRNSDLFIVDDVGKETCGEKLASMALSKSITEKQDHHGQIVIVSHIPKTRLKDHYLNHVVEEIKSFDIIKTI